MPKPTIGSRIEEPGLPPTKFRPVYGVRPKITTERPPNPLLSLLWDRLQLPPAFRNHRQRRLEEVDSGPVYDALSALMEAYPKAANRVSDVQIIPESRTSDDALGSVYGRGFRVYPSNMRKFGKEMFGNISPIEQLRKVMEHETAHIVGYDEPEAWAISPGTPYKPSPLPPIPISGTR